jgi:hypothetical protein
LEGTHKSTPPMIGAMRREVTSDRDKEPSSITGQVLAQSSLREHSTVQAIQFDVRNALLTTRAR